MGSRAEQLKEALQRPEETAVYYFASTEAELLREAAAGVRAAFEKLGEEATRIDGPAPDMGEVIAAAGAISFLGGKRLVELREIAPSAMSDKDAEELAELMGQLDNAVLLISALYKDKRAESGKKSKLLLAAAKKAGLAVTLAKPTRQEDIAFIERQAAELGAGFAPGAAALLYERAGGNRPLLRSETEKLAAMSGYGTISKEFVEQHSARNLEADAFELSRLLVARRKKACYQKLAQLLALRHEPIAITAALGGVFVDMYRVRCGADTGKRPTEVYKDMGYTGSEWRLQKAAENAAGYSTGDIERALLYLEGLDSALKSSALGDKTLLLEACLGRLLALGGRA